MVMADPSDLGHGKNKQGNIILKFHVPISKQGLRKKQQIIGSVINKISGRVALNNHEFPLTNSVTQKQKKCTYFQCILNVSTSLLLE